MNLKNYFDISRFWLLLKMELFRSRKGVIMTLVISFGMLFFISLLLETFLEPKTIYDRHQENYAWTLAIGGFILSSLAFTDLSSTLKRYNYLALPVSTLEKFICMWLLTSVGWIILFSISYVVYTWLANLIGPLIFSHITFRAFEPMSWLSIITIKSYFVLQGIFLVGSSHFKGYVFPKTLFTLVLFALLCGTIFYFVMVDLFLMEHVCSSAEECELLNAIKIHPMSLLLQWLFWWVLAPLSWLITYIGLKEQEV